jgi:hypothetical protein
MKGLEPVEAGALEKAGLDQRQVVGRLAAEEFGKVHAVVSRAGLFAEHRDLHIGQAGLTQAFEKFVAHHAVANQYYFHHAHLSCIYPGPTAGNRHFTARPPAWPWTYDAKHPPRNHGCGLELPGDGPYRPRLARGVPPSLAEEDYHSAGSFTCGQAE